MIKYFTTLPLFGLLLFTGCSQQQTRYSAVPHMKIPNYSRYNYDIKVPTAEYEFSNEKLASMIKELEGCPYVWAEEGPNTFDCSGYLYYMFGKMGIQIPRVAREQIKYGTPIEMSNLKFGDFVFFNTTKTKSDKITHVGIYLKDGWFSHASSSSGKITYANLYTNKFFNERFMGARRYAQENSYVAFEPKLSMYAINQTNQVNEVTNYANNNAKSTVKLAMLEKPEPVKNQKIALAVTMQKPTVNTIKVAEAKQIQQAVTVPNIKPIDEVTKVAIATNITPLVSKDVNLLQASNTNIEVSDSIQIAKNELPLTTNLDIKATEIQPDATHKPTEVKVAEVKTIEPIKVAKQTTTKIAAAKIKIKTETVLKTNPNGYYVQLGQFQNKPNNSLLKKITNNGYAYTLMPSTDSNNKLSKLLIGPFKNKQDAGNTLKDVQDNIEQTSFVTKVNS